MTIVMQEGENRDDRRYGGQRTSGLGSAIAASSGSSSSCRPGDRCCDGARRSGDERAAAVVRGRDRSVAAVLDRDDERLLVVAGPCSVHDPEAALDYAAIASRPWRPTLGDRPAGRDAGLLREAAHDRRLEGLINDPHLTAPATSTPVCGSPASCCSTSSTSASWSAASSSIRSRRSTSPTAVAWGAIGARTTESQTHRQLGSGALDAGRVQEPNRRQRPGRGRRRPSRGSPARVRGHRRRGGAGDPATRRETAEVT